MVGGGGKGRLLRERERVSVWRKTRGGSQKEATRLPLFFFFFSTWI
jgi:hypothetical protein